MKACDRLFLQLGTDFVMDIGKGRGGGIAGFGDQDQVPAEIGFDRAGDLADLGGNNGVFEGLYHGAQTEPTQITARGRRTVGGIGLGDLGKSSAALNFGQKLFGLFLGVHQNMRGVVFGRRGDLFVFGVIGRLNRLFGDGIGDPGTQGDVGQIAAALIGQGKRVLLGQRVAKRLHQRLLLDQLIQDALEQHVIGQGLVLVGQAAAGDDDVAKRDVDPVHRGKNGIGGGIFRLGGHRQQGRQRKSRAKPGKLDHLTRS